SPHRSEPRRSISRGERARATSRVRVRSHTKGRTGVYTDLGETSAAAKDEHDGVEERPRACCGELGKAERRSCATWLSQGESPRSAARVRTTASRVRRVVRGSPRLARSQGWSCHDALLCRRAWEPHCCCGESLRRKLPQIPHDHLITAQGD